MTDPRTGRPLPTLITISRWVDPEVEASGHLVTSNYVETFWLPILGPSATWMARRFAAWVYGTDADDELQVDMIDLAMALGLPRITTGKNSPCERTFWRLVTFGVTQRRPGSSRVTAHFDVRTHMPVLSAQRLERLPDSLRKYHERAVRA